MERPDTDAQRRSTLVRARIFVIVLVGLSAGLIGVYAEASIAEILAAIIGGSVLGIVLAWFVVPAAHSAE